LFLEQGSNIFLCDGRRRICIGDFGALFLMNGNTDFNMIAMRPSRSWSVCRLVEKVISPGISTVLQSTAFASSVVGLLSGARRQLQVSSRLQQSGVCKVGKIEG